MSKIATSEYDPYYQYYIDLAGTDDLINTLKTYREEFLSEIRNIPVSKADYSYADKKWTVKELLLHIIDTERVFQYRALCFSRKDTTPLPGFDENDYASNSNAAKRSLDFILEEFMSVRAASISLFKAIPAEELCLLGTASGKPMSVRALGRAILGHQKHHLNVLKERYLV